MSLPFDSRGDDGAADPRLAAALAAYDLAPAELWAALAGARVFLALEARAGAGVGDPAHDRADDHDRGAEMVLLGLTVPSGARALPAFLDGHQVQRWRSAARPVPLPGPQACQAVLDDGADVLLLDPLGAAIPVGGAELSELAAGRVPVAGAALSTRRAALQRAGAGQELRDRQGLGPAGRAAVVPDATGAVSAADEQSVAVGPGLLAALGHALRPERAVGAARIMAGPDGPVLGLVLRSHLPASELLALADRVRERLGTDLPPDGLDLAELPPDGPGVPVPLGRRWWKRS